MDVSYSGVATREDGYILRVDGSSAFAPYSNLVLVSKQDWEDYNANAFEKLKDSVALKDAKLRDYQPGTDAKYKEYLKIYAPVAFPK